MPITQALLTAAARLSSLDQRGTPKVLRMVHGLPIIVHVVNTLREAGVLRVVVTLGFHADMVQAELSRHDFGETQIEYLVLDQWKRGHASSILSAKKHFKEPFLLCTADHLFSVDLMRAMSQVKFVPSVHAFVLADDSPHVIESEHLPATAVRLLVRNSDRVVAIGRDIAEYNALEAGVFAFRPIIFTALAKMVANNLYFTLADAVAQLVEQRGVRVQWTRGQRWIGLETVTALQHVEKLDPTTIASLTASPVVHRRTQSAVSSSGAASDVGTPPESPRPAEQGRDPTPPASLGRVSTESADRRLVNVTFKVVMDTEYDEDLLELCILGDGRLGNWSSASCLVLKMEQQTNAAGEDETIWTTSLELEEMMTLQYKYVLRKKQSRRIHLWEALAENHQVTPVGEEMLVEQCAFPVEDDPADKASGRPSFGLSARRIDSGWLDGDFQVQIKFGTWEGQPAVQTESEVLPTKKVTTTNEIPVGVISTPPTGREKPKRRAKGARPGSDSAVPSAPPVKPRFHASGHYGFMVDVLVPKPTIEVTRLRHEPSVALVTGPTLTSLAFVIDVYDETPDADAGAADGAGPFAPKHLGRVHITPQDLEDHVSRGSSLYDMPLQRPIVQLNGRMSGILNFEMLIVNPFVHPKNNLCYTFRSVWAAGRVLDIGHRGFGHSAPGEEMSGAVQENTVLSFITAAKHGGDFVEFDVHLTKDNVPIIYHNFALDILVGSQTVKLPINQLTLEEIRSLFTKSGTVDEDDDEPDGVHGVVVQTTSPAKDATDAAADDAPYPRLGMPLVKPDPPSGMDYSDPDRPRHVQRDAEVEANVGHAPRGSHKVRKTRSAEAAPTKKKKGKQKFQSLIADGIATLEEVLREVPSHLGFNIEIKYPMFYEMIRDPYTFYPKNHFLNVILQCVFDNARSRPIIFSSFEPDIVAMLAQKQTRYPVFFLTTAGQSENARDVRAISLEHAVRWAILHPIRGVVSEAQAILDDISRVAEVKRHELLLFSYGRANNDPYNVRLQKESGVDAIITDKLKLVASSKRKV